MVIGTEDIDGTEEGEEYNRRVEDTLMSIIEDNDGVGGREAEDSLKGDSETFGYGLGDFNDSVEDFDNEDQNLGGISWHGNLEEVERKDETTRLVLKAPKTKMRTILSLQKTIKDGSLQTMLLIFLISHQRIKK